MELTLCDEPSGAPADYSRALEERFTLVKRLGKNLIEDRYDGINGIVLLITHGNEEKALKITSAKTASQRELHLACALHELDAMIFSHVYGYLYGLPQSIPATWRPYIGELPQNFALGTNLIFTFSDYARYRFMDNDVRFTRKEFKSILYILLHDLQEAFDRLGFTHGDIHDEQILLVPRPNTRDPIHVGTHTLTSRFVPKLIDYGESRAQGTREQHEEDLSSLLLVMRYKLYALKSQGSVTPEDVQEFKDAERAGLTLTSPYFAELGSMGDENARVQARCIHCATPAAYYHENKRHLVCSQVCATIWSEKYSVF